MWVRRCGDRKRKVWNRLLWPSSQPLLFFFFFFWSGVTICRFVLHKNKAIHLPYVVSCKLRKKPQHSRGAPGGKVTYLPRPGSALPRRHPPLDSGGGFCLSPWHTMKCREHMLRVRWGLTKVKNGTAALIVSQHQWRLGLGPEWNVMFPCCLRRRCRQSPPDSTSRQPQKGKWGEGCRQRAGGSWPPLGGPGTCSTCNGNSAQDLRWSLGRRAHRRDDMTEVSRPVSAPRLTNLWPLFCHHFPTLSLWCPELLFICALFTQPADVCWESRLFPNWAGCWGPNSETVERWGGWVSEGFPGSSVIKNPPANAGDAGSIPGSEMTPWRKAWHPTPVFFPGRTSRTEEPGGLQTMGSQRVRHDWATEHAWMGEYRLQETSESGNPG